MHVRRKQDGSLEVIPSADRKVIDQFVDHATGYLVVCELRVDNPSDRDIYYTVVERQTGAVVPPARRAAELPGDEQVTVDPVHGLQLAVRRTIDPRTGAEALHERLIDVATGRSLATRQSTALSARPRPSLLESHLGRAAEGAASEAFWNDEYRRMPLAARQAWWLERVLHQMRVQGEAGLDEYALFNPPAYADWRARDPDIDLILDFVIEHIPDNRDVRGEIDRRIGRRRNG